MTTPFEVSKTYSFETHAPALLGSIYRAATIVAIMDYQTAIKERDITAAHHSVYGSLPPGLPDDPAATLYVKLRLQSGDFTILGISWIRLDTIQEINMAYVTVNVYDAAVQDVQRIRDILAIAGYNNITISFNPQEIVHL